MTIMRLPHVKRVRAKGRDYWYHRKTNERLPAEPQARAARILEINRGLKPSAAPRPHGSFDALIAAYRASAEYASLKPGSRRVYGHYLDLIGAHRGRAARWGALPVALLRRADILHMRDKYKARPATANYLLAVLRLLLAFAVEREWLAANPAEGIRGLRSRARAHRSWTEGDIAAVLAAARPETAIALMLGLYTGQRLGDVLRMSWADMEGDEIRVVQAKHGKRLWIPMMAPLRAALGKIDRSSPVIVNSAAGGPLRRSTFEARWLRDVRKAGRDGLTFHGLRHTLAGGLAESGAGTDWIKAVTGHRSTAEVQRYTAQADQRAMARAAITQLENHRRKNRGRKNR